MPDVVYVGLQDDKIVSFGIDVGAGKLVPGGETPAAGAPSVFAASPDQRVLYVGYRGTPAIESCRIDSSQRRANIAGARLDRASADLSRHRPHRQIPPVGPSFLCRFEPTTLISSLRASTGHIGLGATLSTSFGEPYHVARTFGSIDHITKRRRPGTW
jgi:hypothetical protein